MHVSISIPRRPLLAAALIVGAAVTTAAAAQEKLRFAVGLFQPTPTDTARLTSRSSNISLTRWDARTNWW